MLELNINRSWCGSFESYEKVFEYISTFEEEIKFISIFPSSYTDKPKGYLKAQQLQG
jgi:hypothetical protein